MFCNRNAKNGGRITTVIVPWFLKKKKQTISFIASAQNECLSLLFKISQLIDAKVLLCR